jgi:hypothetical protein
VPARERTTTAYPTFCSVQDHVDHAYRRRLPVQLAAVRRLTASGERLAQTWNPHDPHRRELRSRAACQASFATTLHDPKEAHHAERDDS